MLARFLDNCLQLTQALRKWLSNLKTVDFSVWLNIRAAVLQRRPKRIQAELRRKHQLTQGRERPFKCTVKLLDGLLGTAGNESLLVSSWCLMFTFTWISYLTSGLFNNDTFVFQLHVVWGTCGSRTVGVLLAAAVLLSVCALLRVLQAQFVANLERLADGPNDTHGLTLARWWEKRKERHSLIPWTIRVTFRFTSQEILTRLCLSGNFSSG